MNYIVYFFLSWSIMIYFGLYQFFSDFLRKSQTISAFPELSWGIPGILGYLVLLRYLGPTRSSSSILVYFCLSRYNLVYLSLSLSITAYFSLSRPISAYFDFLFYLVLSRSILVYLGLFHAISGNLRLSWAIAGSFYQVIAI